jgi:hypothetical protein
MLSKRGARAVPLISLRATCLLLRRQPVYRRHEFDTGFSTERENLDSAVKGNDKWQTPRGRIPMQEPGAEPLVVALKRL